MILWLPNEVASSVIGGQKDGRIRIVVVSLIVFPSYRLVRFHPLHSFTSLPRTIQGEQLRHHVSSLCALDSKRWFCGRFREGETELIPMKKDFTTFRGQNPPIIPNLPRPSPRR